MGLGPSISSVIDKCPSYSGPSYLSSPVIIIPYYHNSYRCRYILSSAVDDVVCVDGTWDGGNNIKCAPVDCGQPLLTHAKVMCPDGTRYSKQCTFKCSPPALMQGSQNIITCDADGLWSLPDAYCKPMCGRARTPDHSMLISKDCSGDRHEIGTTCRYRCSRGYHIAGLSVRR